jgi:hypothetical protein
MATDDEIIREVTEREPDIDVTSRISARRVLKIFRHQPPEKRRVTGEQLIIHRYKKAEPALSEMVKEGKLKNAFRNSDLSDLAIVTVHNYDEKTLFEQSLDFLGVEDYTVLKHSGEWKMVYKFMYLLEFIEECRKPYILFCDARDSIFTDDPAKAMVLFKEFGCEAVFNATMSSRGIFKSFQGWSLPLYWWTRMIAKTTWRKRYPNAGAFIGKKQLMKEISETILYYCELMECRYPPKSDQDVLRAIYPWFWPRMTCDYYNKMFYRN